MSPGCSPGAIRAPVWYMLREGSTYKRSGSMASRALREECCLPMMPARPLRGRKRGRYVMTKDGLHRVRAPWRRLANSHDSLPQGGLLSEGNFQSASAPFTASGVNYHLRIGPDDVAPTILLPGDPDRVALISAGWDHFREAGRNREFVTHTGQIQGVPISAIST